MPLVVLKPTKARLVMENAKESVLVMKVVLDAEDAVELSTGGSLQDLGGVLRIRERKANGSEWRSEWWRDDRFDRLRQRVRQRRVRGSPAKFQVNVTMASEKFTTLLRVANAGRLPTKFMVDAGDRSGGAETKALGYRMRAGARIKVWDNHAFRVLPVFNFVMILPIDVPAVPTRPAAAAESTAPVALATNAQVAELMDDMLVFQSDTRNIDVRPGVRAGDRRAGVAGHRPRHFLPLAALPAASCYPRGFRRFREGRNDERARFPRPHGGHHRRRDGHRPRRRAAARRRWRTGRAVGPRRAGIGASEGRARSATPSRGRSTSPTRPPSRAWRRRRRPRSAASTSSSARPASRVPTCRWPTIRSTTGSACSTSTCTACSCAIARSVPLMQKKDYGRIVNIASVAGKEGNPNASAYSASKAAVIGLTKSLGKELAKSGIRVNCVTPAAVRTAIFDQMTQQHIDFMLSKIPMGGSARSTRSPHSCAGSRPRTARSRPARCSTCRAAGRRTDQVSESADSWQLAVAAATRGGALSAGARVARRDSCRRARAASASTHCHWKRREYRRLPEAPRIGA